VSDIEDIQMLISLYSEAGALRDWESLVSTFTRDGAWKLAGTDISLDGHAALRAGFPQFVAHMDYLLSINAPAIIAVDGDKATARSLIREAGKVKDADTWMELFGRYEDKLVRTKDGWRFALRTFTSFSSTHLAVVPAA
jgi:hypothetical protein